MSRLVTALTVREIRARLLRAARPYARNKGSTGVTGWCLHHKINKGHVSTFMNGSNQIPSDVLRALGLERAIVARRPTRGKADV